MTDSNEKLEADNEHRSERNPNDIERKRGNTRIRRNGEEWAEGKILFRNFTSVKLH